MQQEDTKQDDDATTHASKSFDKTMTDKRDNARRIAEQLLAEERRGHRRSAVRTYLIAVIIGLIIWAAIYFLWQML
jgi:Flp pilus assembly protein TadB